MLSLDQIKEIHDAFYDQNTKKLVDAPVLLTDHFEKAQAYTKAYNGPSLADLFLDKVKVGSDIHTALKDRKEVFRRLKILQRNGDQLNSNQITALETIIGHNEKLAKLPPVTVNDPQRLHIQLKSNIPFIDGGVVMPMATAMACLTAFSDPKVYRDAHHLINDFTKYYGLDLASLNTVDAVDIGKVKEKHQKFLQDITILERFNNHEFYPLSALPQIPLVKPKMIFLNEDEELEYRAEVYSYKIKVEERDRRIEMLKKIKKDQLALLAEFGIIHFSCQQTLNAMGAQVKALIAKFAAQPKPKEAADDKNAKDHHESTNDAKGNQDTSAKDKEAPKDKPNEQHKDHWDTKHSKDSSGPQSKSQYQSAHDDTSKHKSDQDEAAKAAKAAKDKEEQAANAAREKAARDAKAAKDAKDKADQAAAKAREELAAKAAREKAAREAQEAKDKKAENDKKAKDAQGAKANAEQAEAGQDRTTTTTANPSTQKIAEAAKKGRSRF